MTPPGVRAAARWVLGLAIFAGLASVGLTRLRGFCTECGTGMRTSSLVIVAPWDGPDPVLFSWESDLVPSAVSKRWFPPDHDHVLRRSVASSMRGMFGLMSANGHGRGFPGEFALAAEHDPALADFVDAEIAARRIDIETVRALCAVPPSWGSDEAEVAQSQALRRRGCELVGAWRGVAPEETNLWGTAPWENGFADPPVRGCPGPEPAPASPR